MGNGIFTRNYDNIMAFARIPKTQELGETLDTSRPYGDKSLRVKTYRLTEIILKTSAYAFGDLSHKGNFCSCPLSFMYNIPTKDAPTLATNRCVCMRTSLFVGKDNTEETYDDVDLVSSSVISNAFNTANDLQYTTFSVDDLSYDEDNEAYKRTFHYNFVACKNTVIGEFGLYYNIRAVNNQTDAHCLIYRKALESPIELEQNQTVRISMTISVPANPNKPVSVDIDAE